MEREQGTLEALSEAHLEQWMASYTAENAPEQVKAIIATEDDSRSLVLWTVGMFSSLFIAADACADDAVRSRYVELIGWAASDQGMNLEWWAHPDTEHLMICSRNQSVVVTSIFNLCSIWEGKVWANAGLASRLRCASSISKGGDDELDSSRARSYRLSIIIQERLIRSMQLHAAADRRSWTLSWNIQSKVSVLFPMSFAGQVCTVKSMAWDEMVVVCRSLSPQRGCGDYPLQLSSYGAEVLRQSELAVCWSEKVRWSEVCPRWSKTSLPQKGNGALPGIGTRGASAGSEPSSVFPWSFHVHGLSVHGLSTSMVFPRPWSFPIH